MQAETLEALLFALNSDPDKAAHAYGQLHQRLVRLFEFNLGSDAHALADETLDRLARRIHESSPGEVTSPQAFAVGIARHLILEDARKRARDNNAAAEWTIRHPAEDENGELLDAVDQCLSQMPADQRELLRSYYDWNGSEKIEHHRQLAEHLGVTLNALRNRLMRARRELDRCVRKRCGDISKDSSIKE